MSSGTAACGLGGGMTLPCRGCATDKRLRVSRPAHCHRHERESHRRPPSAKALQRPIEPPVRPTASPKPASRTGKAHWFLSDPTASSRHCCQARWCWFPPRLHTPTPDIPAGQRSDQSGQHDGPDPNFPTHSPQIPDVSRGQPDTSGRVPAPPGRDAGQDLPVESATERRKLCLCQGCELRACPSPFR